jgi:hypothetical protein
MRTNGQMTNMFLVMLHCMFHPSTGSEGRRSRLTNVMAGEMVIYMHNGELPVGNCGDVTDCGTPAVGDVKKETYR